MDRMITHGDKYGPAMAITTQAEADAYFEDCVQHCMSFGRTREEAEEIERANIGYWTGYYDRETAERVFKLFRCAHPIFGTRRPTPEQALEMGKAFGLGFKLGKEGS